MACTIRLPMKSTKIHLNTNINQMKYKTSKVNLIMPQLPPSGRPLPHP